MKNNPFDGLRKQLGLPEPVEPVEPVEPATAPVKRAVLRYERSGRGGKEVTVIEQLGLSQADLDAWLTHLKSALGCGGSIDDDAIVLQGDHRKRLPQILTARGVRKVTVG